MNAKEIADIIKDQAFFEDLKPEFVNLLTDCAFHVNFKNGHFLLTQDTDANNFYIIVHGNVAIEINAGDNGPVTIQKLGAGDILGWSWLIPPYKWRFDALAVDPTEVISFDGKCLRTKCDDNYEFGYDMMKRMTAVISYRLLNTRMKLMDFYS